jgi:hypothetical protein
MGLVRCSTVAVIAGLLLTGCGGATARFGPGSPGSCGRASRCHAEEMRDASSAYDWLARRGYIDGTWSPLVNPSNSCLRWFGGNMPPQQAPPAEDATRDLQAWVAAGASDD